MHDAQQDGGSHFQQSHQQNFQQAKGGFACKQAAAALQGVEELWHTAFDLDLPQAAGKHGHQHRHQNGFNDGQAVKQGAVTVGKLLRVCRGKAAHPQHDNAGDQQAESKVMSTVGFLQFCTESCHLTPPPRWSGSG